MFLLPSETRKKIPELASQNLCESKVFGKLKDKLVNHKTIAAFFNTRTCYREKYEEEYQSLLIKANALWKHKDMPNQT